MQETGDQLRCIAEIKADMERPVPMDRLLCGDVGYGKTEVALRAVMKCVLEGKQAAILVPTTVLASQHYQTALRRFEGYPVKIAVVSRFQTGKELKQILADLKSGFIDVLIGTHRLLQKDVEFKDLGLLVVDEEQRFGVTHKERLKEISRQVDVLTLSATPIPRTLNMALSGIRDMSTIEEPPHGSAAGADLCAGARLVGAGGRHPPGDRPGRSGLLSSTTGWRPLNRPPPTSARMLGDEVDRGGGPRQDESGGAGPASWSAWWTARCRCWCAPPSSRPASTSPM